MSSAITRVSGLTTRCNGGAHAHSKICSTLPCLEHDYPLGFRTVLHCKDLGIALGTGKELGVPMPVAAYVEQLETGLVKRGYGDEDVSNIARAVREAAGL